MSKNFKAEVYSQILEDAKHVESVPGKPNTYTPDDYQKVRAQSLLMGLIDDGEYLVPKIPTGAVEMNPDGTLKSIARNRPAMLDLNFYTRNRYEVETVIPANEKKMGLERGTYILVLMGNPIVRAIADTVELPKTIRAFRFKKTVTEAEVAEDTPAVDEEGNEEVVKAGEKATVTFWKYVGAEMIPAERAYKMTKSLDAKSMLELIAQVEQGTLNADDEVSKDSLDEIG